MNHFRKFKTFGAQLLRNHSSHLFMCNKKGWEKKRTLHLNAYMSFGDMSLSQNIANVIHVL